MPNITSSAELEEPSENESRRGSISQGSKSVRRLTYQYENPDSGLISTTVKFLYGNPGFATTSLSFLIAVYATDFYVGLGAKLSFLSFFTALARSFDVMTDPLMGWISDSTRRPFGRRRPYMLVGCVPYAICFILLFTPPESLSGNSVAYWFGLFYPIFYLCDTFSNVPYEALGPELSDNYDERNRLFFVKKTINFLGTLFAAGAPAMFAWYFRGGEDVEFPCSLFYDAVAVQTDSDPETLLPYFWNSTLTNASPCNQTMPARYCQQAERCYTSTGAFCFFVEGSVLNETHLINEDGAESYYQAEKDSLDEFCLSAISGGYDLNDDNEVQFAFFEISDIDSQRSAFTLVAILFGLYYIVTMLILVFKVQERPASTQSGPVPLVASILRSFKNIAFRPLLCGWALDGLALSALVSMFPFFVRYVVIPDGAKAQEHGTDMSPQVCMGLAVFALLAAAVLAAPLWLMIASRTGKYKAWLLYNLVNAATNILFIIPKEGDPMYTISISFLNGIPVGGQFLIDSILADTIDYDEFLNGTRSEAAFSVFATLIPKFVAIPAGALPLAIVNMLGFEPPDNGVNQPQTDTVKAFIRYVFVLLPFICVVLSFMIKLRFPIKTRRMSQQISDGIELHMRGLPAFDPVTGHEIDIMRVPEEDEPVVWLLENFGNDSLKGMLEENGPRRCILSMARLFALSIGMLTFFTGLVVAFFPSLDDPSLSLIPILAVIGAGMSLCFLAVSYMRYKASLDLGKLFIGPTEQQDNTRRILRSLLHHKAQGQRAGDAVVDEEKLRQHHESPIAPHTFSFPPSARSGLTELSNRDRQTRGSTVMLDATATHVGGGVELQPVESYRGADDP